MSSGIFAPFLRMLLNVSESVKAMFKLDVPMPAARFGIVLGLLSLANSYRLATTLFEWPKFVGEVFAVIGAVAWLVAITLYIYKWVLMPKAAMTEFNHPVMGNFVALAPVTTILFGMVFRPWLSPVGSFFIWLGVLVITVFAVYKIRDFWLGKQTQEIISPAMYLPSLAGMFVAAMGLANLDQQVWALLYLGAGLINWITIEPAVVSRLRHLELPPPMRPSIGIQVAPGMVAAATWIAVTGQFDFFALFFLGYGILQLLIALSTAGWIFKPGFDLGHWSFSFGLASMVGLGARLANDRSPIIGLEALGIGLMIIGTAGIAALAVASIMKLLMSASPQPAGPVQPAQPAETAQSAEVAQPVQQTEVALSAEDTEDAEPTEQVEQPTESAQPEESAGA